MSSGSNASQTKFECPQCAAPYAGDVVAGGHARCSSCSAWLVVDRQGRYGSSGPLRVYRYQPLKKGERAEVVDHGPGKEPTIRIECPYCGRIHTHGGLGFRLSHCQQVSVRGHGDVVLAHGSHGRPYWIVMHREAAPEALPTTRSDPPYPKFPTFDAYPTN